ncbi:PAS domain S-box protein [Vannielia litorea]|uniref:ATP-binding protein n=1 Tax=Vannielia litorea TaxID=1217970 RepID=UPI001C960F20|nr:ATP-binding protein [Vannielia litorea]MBY6154202.1 PAS domain S-box protein [Vannielia litorea]
MLKQVDSVPEGDLPADARHDHALRQLFYLSLDPDLAFSKKVSELLALGCEALQLPLGIVSRIEDANYRIDHVEGEDWAPAAGTEFDLAETYCTHTLAADAVRYFHHAGQSEIAEHPCYTSFGLESYIGVPLRVGHERVGTLNFSGPDARTPFSDKEKDLVDLFGRWLGQEWLKEKRTQELAEKTMVLNAIIETVPDAIIAVDENRRLTLVNRATEATFGFTKGEMIGQTTSMFFADQDSFDRQGEDIYKKVRESGDGRIELEVKRRNGELFPGELFMAPLRQPGGQRLGLLGVLRDITHRKALDKARAELISTVSHELRQPITAAHAAVKLLNAERQRLSPPLQPTLDIADRNLDQVASLVGDLLDFERLSAGRVPSDMRPVDLEPLLANAIEDLGPFARQHGVELKLDAEGPEPGQVVGDKIRLLQVLTNLVSNAVKASEAGASVVLGTSATRPGFWVRDHGRGIPEELRPRLFERFSRAPESYSNGHSGTGLGLGIAKAIVESHGASLDFETATGKGTTFRVQF